jgi:hypothetical protein
MLNEDLKLLLLWGKEVRWGNRVWFVDVATSQYLYLCPYRGCVPYLHDHLRVPTWILRWDDVSGALRSI